jgi:tRNA splicing endonuclease
MQVDERAGEEELDEFYAAYYGLQPPPAAAQQKPEEQQQHRHHLAAMQQQQPVQEAAWQVAIASDGRFQAPLTVADAAGGSNSSSTTSGAKQQQQEQCGCVMRPVAWGYPRTPLQQLRLAVFGDLAARGFSLTGGSKFGGDFLAYPGDPHLYHAQYVVRVMLPQQALNPSVLQGLARGVHAARKHLLLATLHPAGANGAAADGAAQPGPGGSSEGGGDPLRSAAAALSAAATRAAAAALLRDGGGELRYITVVRDSGWGAE